MKLIVGLGNPEQKYEKTRHNTGFMAIDMLSGQLGFNSSWKENHQALIQAGVLKDENVLLVKPQTYMNNSGTAVAEIIHYYKLPLSDLVVVYDDFDILLGTIRIRKTGSSGGHNGLQSIINAVKSEDFVRVRLGIGNAEDENFVTKRIPRQDYVLSPFHLSEEKTLQEMLVKSTDILRCILEKDIDYCLSTYQSL